MIQADVFSFNLLQFLFSGLNLIIDIAIILLLIFIIRYLKKKK